MKAVKKDIRELGIQDWKGKKKELNTVKEDFRKLSIQYWEGRKNS